MEKSMWIIPTWSACKPNDVAALQLHQKCYFIMSTESELEHLQVPRLSLHFPRCKNWESVGSRNGANVARNSAPEKNLHLLPHIGANIPQQVRHIYSPTCKHSVYGKQPGYLPTSEAITVMLCQGMSSLSRGCVVRMTPLASSILKYLTPSSLLSR